VQNICFGLYAFEDGFALAGNNYKCGTCFFG